MTCTAVCPEPVVCGVWVGGGRAYIVLEGAVSMAAQLYRGGQPFASRAAPHPRRPHLVCLPETELQLLDGGSGRGICIGQQLHRRDCQLARVEHQLT